MKLLKAIAMIIGVDENSVPYEVAETIDKDREQILARLQGMGCWQAARRTYMEEKPQFSDRAVVQLTHIECVDWKSGASLASVSLDTDGFCGFERGFAGLAPPEGFVPADARLFEIHHDWEWKSIDPEWVLTVFEKAIWNM